MFWWPVQLTSNKNRGRVVPGPVSRQPLHPEEEVGLLDRFRGRERSRRPLQVARLRHQQVGKRVELFALGLGGRLAGRSVDDGQALLPVEPLEAGRTN